MPIINYLSIIKEMNRIIVSYITNPFYNLAIENDILINTRQGEKHLFIFINSPCVVMGRFQNPWIECNLTLMKEMNVPLVRRQSGGGTVYHDQQNLNFSFIADRKLHSQNDNHKIIVQVLNDLGVKTYATKRGDIRLADGTDRKISGSAFKQKKDQALHHGTLLIDTDLDMLNRYITSDKRHLPTKSISSVRSQVANICEFNKKMNADILIKALQEEFENQSSHNCEIITFHEEKALNEGMHRYAQEIQSHEWRFLETPKFFVSEKIHMVDGEFLFDMEIRKGKIDKIIVDSTAVHPAYLQEIESCLLHAVLVKDVLISKIKNLKKFDSVLSDQMCEWFLDYFSL